MARFIVQDLLLTLPDSTLIWQVDDDQLFEVTSLNKSGQIVSAKAYSAFHRALELMSASRADVLLGALNRDPAVPASSAMYGEMVDLLHFFEQAEKLAPEKPMPSQIPDLRKYTHPESNIDFNLMKNGADDVPFHPRPVFVQEGETLGDTLMRLLNTVEYIFTGSPLSRPLLIIRGLPMRTSKQARSSRRSILIILSFPEAMRCFAAKSLWKKSRSL